MNDHSNDKNHNNSADISKDHTGQREGRETSAQSDKNRDPRSEEMSNDTKSAKQTNPSQSQSGSTNFVGSKGSTDSSENLVDKEQRSSGNTPSGK